MFTIKHLTPMGNESLHTAVEVNYAPHVEPIQLPCKDEDVGKYLPSIAALSFLRQFVAGEASICIMDGLVYVMNDKGATVAKYDLGGWPTPQPPH